MYDVIIIGAGPAGLSAAIYALRAGKKVLLLEGEIYGGQIVETPEIENYPGIKSISGAELAIQMWEHAESLGAELRQEKVTRAMLCGRVKTIITEGGEYEASAVIIANGAKRRKLDCPGEQRLTGRGVSYCATCDGAFFKGKTAAVVGGGNTALEDALYLSALCTKVYLIHRRDEFRGARTLQDRVLAAGNIELRLKKVPVEITGSDRVEAIKLREAAGEAEETVATDAVFVAVGQQPENSVFAGQVELDEAGYIMAGEDCRTSCPGVFAAGDTRTKRLRQVVTAVADGAVAGSSV